MEGNTRRYISLFADAASALLPHPSPGIDMEPDIFDVLVQHVSTAMQSKPGTCLCRRKA